jgi:hypothetical protein
MARQKKDEGGTQLIRAILQEAEQKKKTLKHGGYGLTLAYTL